VTVKKKQSIKQRGEKGTWVTSKSKKKAEGEQTFTRDHGLYTRVQPGIVQTPVRPLRTACWFL
jgi:hypothetical protein